MLNCMSFLPSLEFWEKTVPFALSTRYPRPLGKVSPDREHSAGKRKYLLLIDHEFQGRIVSYGLYGLRFFHFILCIWPSAKHKGHEWKQKKTRDHNIQYIWTKKMRLVRYLSYLLVVGSN